MHQDPGAGGRGYFFFGVRFGRAEAATLGGFGVAVPAAARPPAARPLGAGARPAGTSAVGASAFFRGARFFGCGAAAAASAAWRASSVTSLVTG